MPSLVGSEMCIRDSYNLDDLLDAHEILAVTHENERRSSEASKEVN